MPDDAGTDSSDAGVNVKGRGMRSEYDTPARAPAMRAQPAIPTNMRSLRWSGFIVSCNRSSDFRNVCRSEWCEGPGEMHGVRRFQLSASFLRENHNAPVDVLRQMAETGCIQHEVVP